MLVLALGYWNLKRLARRREVLGLLFALPLAAALLRCAAAHSPAAGICAWMCPLLCAVLSAIVLWAQCSTDRASGLHAGIRSTPLTDSAILGARVTAGVILIAAQAAVFLSPAIARAVF